jgi:uncharacterized membrane protein
MISLLFLGCVAAIFLLVVAMEDGELALRLQHRPAGLLAWLTGGNWPAKVGAALVVIGVGALLRYLLLNIDIPTQAKLGTGIVIAAALGFASVFVPGGAARRTLSLALGGAAFGVAYLTAYSAFALFGYVPSGTGLALLALVSAGAGVYAVTRGAMALAILAMFGAYLAPAFAVGDPGPLVVYGYYAGASTMTLVLVALRGWRPLIHLSFLFTLAGGAFLAWTSRYYDPSHADVMQPMLLLLAALHVAMPVAERGGAQATWMQRLDVVYMIALPSVAALLTLMLASSRAEFATMMLWFNAIWATAAAATPLRGRSGAAALAAIAVLFLILAAAARFQNIPWELAGLAASVATLALTTWRSPALTSLHSVTAGFVALFGFLHVLSTLTEPASGALFGNPVFVSRLAGALLLIIAGVLCRRARQVLDTLLLATGVLWLFIAMGMELVRWELATIALVVNWLFILLATSVWIPGRKLRWADDHPTVVAVLLALSSWWAAHRAGATAAWISLCATGFAGLALSARMARLGRPHALDRAGPVLGTVVAVALWATVFAPPTAAGGLQFVLTTAGCTTLLAMGLVHLLTDADDRHTEDLVTGAAVSFATVLGLATLLHISREPWAGALEACCLAGLVLAALIRRSRPGGVPGALLVSLTVGVALTLQAYLVRWLAPPGPLNLASVFGLSEPGLVSLLWAGTGCVLTWWSRRAASRPLWIAGASLLIATALKVMLLDFDSLGQLTNILAVIAAGIVFLAVGWLAPMPPAATASAAQPRRAPARMALLIPVVIGLFDTTGWYRSTLPVVSHWEPVAETPVTVQQPELPAWEPDVAATAPVAELAAEPPMESVDAPQVAADAAVVPESARLADTPRSDPVVVATAPVPAPAPAVPQAAREWQRPPVIGADGVRNYNDYSYPVPRATSETRRDSSERSAASSPVDRKPTSAEIEMSVSMLLREGRMVPATRRDLDQYQSSVRGDTAAAQRLRLNSPAEASEPVFRTYVVKRALTLPPGLHGAHRLILIVPRGVPYPLGDPGHSQILVYPGD